MEMSKLEAKSSVATVVDSTPHSRDTARMDPYSLVDTGQGEDGQEDVCRVCRSGAESGPLSHPCRCSGSMRFVHEQCLNEWLNVRKKAIPSCELCGAALVFAQVFSPSMPAELPYLLLARHSLYAVVNAILLVIRAAVVGVTWIGVLPYGTYWTFKAYLWSADVLGIVARRAIGRQDPLPLVHPGSKITAMISAWTRNGNSSLEALNAMAVNLTTKEKTQLTMRGIGLLGDAMARSAAAVNGTTPNTLGDLATLLAPPVCPLVQVRPPIGIFTTIVNDTLQGQVITSIVIVAFVFGFLLREWVLMNGPIAPIQPRELDPVQLEDVQRFVGAAIDEPPPPVGALRQGQQWGVHGTGFDGEDRIYEGEEDESWLYPLEEGGEEGGWDDEVEEAPSAGASGRAYLQDHQQATSDDEQDQGVGSSAGATRESPRRRRKDKARQDDRTQRRIARRARAAERNIRPLPGNAVAPSSSSSQSSTAANQSLDEEEQGRDQRWQAYHEDDGQADDDDDWDDVPALEAWLPQGIERRPDEPEVIVIELPPGLPAEREDDFQDVFDDLEGIMEAIGMRGSLFVLVQNMGLMNLLVGLCLGGGVWVPLCIGRALAAGNSVRGLLLPLRAVRSMSDPVFDALWTTLTFLPRIALSHVAPHIAPLCSSLPSSSLRKACATLFPSIATSPVTISIANTSAESTRPLVISTTKHVLESIAHHWVEMGIAEDPLHRTLCVALGYVAILTVGSFYVHFARDEYGLSFGKIVRETGTLFKVCLFIFIEIILFPAMCGVVLNLATLSLFPNATVASRMAAYVTSPVATFFLTWLGGTICMFSLALGIDTVRDIVRKGFLWFIRDPAAQEFHPIREILQRDSKTQARKIAISGLLYTTTIFATFGINILFLRYACGILPLRWSAERPFSFPMDLVIFRFLVPATIRFSDPRGHLRTAFIDAAKLTARQLRLSSFIFDERNPVEEGSHIRRTWWARLTLKKADLDEVEDDGRDVVSPREVVFRKDGGFARVPAIDNVRVVAGRRMVVPTTEAGVALDAEGARVIGEQLAEMASTRSRDRYAIVYVPPYYKTRIALFVYSLWFTGSIAGMAAVAIPLLVGRAAFSLVHPTQVHDLYSLAVGFYLVIGTILTVRNLPSIVRYRPALSDLFLVLSTLLAMFSIAIVLPILCSLAFTAYILLPFFPPSFYSTFASSPSSSTILTIDLSQEWANGAMICAAAYHILPRYPKSNSEPAVSIEKLKVYWRETGDVAGTLYGASWIAIFDFSCPLILALTIPTSVALAHWKYSPFESTTPFVNSLRWYYGTALVALVAMSMRSTGLVKRWMVKMREDEYLIERKLMNFEA